MRKLLFLTSLMRWGTNALVCFLSLFIAQSQGMWRYLPIVLLVFFDIISLIVVKRNSYGKPFGLSLIDLLVSWVSVVSLLRYKEFIPATIAFALSIIFTLMEYNFHSADNGEDSETD